MVQASAYVKQGRLIVIGVAQLKVGPVPFTYDCQVPEGTPEGPIDINDENPALEECLTEAEQAIKKRIGIGALKVGAENLVLRARQGDQNAMAMLIAVRKNAKDGVPKARAAMRAIKEYIEDHPPTESCQFGHEAKREVATALAKHVENDNPTHYAMAVLTLLPHIDERQAYVLVANGPLVTNNLLELVSSGLTDRQKTQFIAGFKGKPIPSKANQLGEVFRKARELQAARRGQFDEVIAYELG